MGETHQDVGLTLSTFEINLITQQEHHKQLLRTQFLHQNELIQHQKGQKFLKVFY